MIPSSASIFVATRACDMRRAFDGLAAAARDELGHDPRGGALFVFYNARRDRLKLLWWDKTGWCLLYKRLERGCFRIPEPVEVGARCVAVEARELALLLEGVQLPASKLHPRPDARPTQQRPLPAAAVSGSAASA